MIRLMLGDCLERMAEIEDGSVDAVITDPPYSSGGLMRADRMQSTASKYVSSGTTIKRASFDGDNRDQRSFAYWCQIWMTECFRVLKPGGYFLGFTDWRQLPTMTDAVQAGGFIWRGLIPWDKGLGARAPHTGYFRHQCEYVVWGTKGKCGPAYGRGPFPGCYPVSVKQSDKFHQTGKPVDLMRRLVACVPPGSVILDPFMGSGSTGKGAILEGRSFIGIERDPAYFELAERRIAEASEPARLAS